MFFFYERSMCSPLIRASTSQNTREIASDVRHKLWSPETLLGSNKYWRVSSFPEHLLDSRYLIELTKSEFFIPVSPA